MNYCIDLYHETCIIMIQKSNTNSVGCNNNRNPNVRRDGRRGWGGFDNRSSCRDYRNNTSIAKSLFEEKLKDGCLYKLTITECSNWAIQLKKIHDALQILYTDKGYKHLDSIILK